VPGFDVRPHAEALPSIALPAHKRGRLPVGRVTLQTRFPLGLFRAWTHLEPAVECIVFPRPESPGVPLPPPTDEPGEGAAMAVGNEDFSGLRNYHLGDSPRRIAWKAAARDRGLLSKVFAGQADRALWLDWNAMPETLDTEARIARLARWVLEADAAGAAYGLRLPSAVIPPGAGAAQRTRCLEALALAPE
jgi:uncharacterized protein (DUF58 family)